MLHRLVCQRHRARAGARSAALLSRPLSTQYLDKRARKLDELQLLPELAQRDRLLRELEAGDDPLAGVAQHLPAANKSLAPPPPIPADILDTALTAGLLTFALHVESRISSALGEGFYTIGPCGEEPLAAVGLALRPTDPCALHYRHLATSLARGLAAGRSVRDLSLDRARGYTVSSMDPVGGGAHCLLGGGDTDFLVTSTLASQAPPAVGRALGGRLAHLLGGDAAAQCAFPADFVSYVSLGDGSVNNAHFLSAVNLAEYTRHRGFKCPVVFGVSDNDRCISLRGHGWLPNFLKQRLGMPVFRCDGNDPAAVFAATSDAAAYSRSRGAPTTVVFEGLSRRFGHAATDRQDAYLDRAEIAAAAEHSALAGMCAQYVAHPGTTGDHASVARRFRDILNVVQDCFSEAAAEPKLASRDELVARNSAPVVPVKAAAEAPTRAGLASASKANGSSGKKNKTVVMRKNMTRLLEEVLSGKADSSPQKDVVYIGEDVEHGGYYLVSQGLKRKFPSRVADFPPDETGLVGAAIGYAQAGLVPICEIPYAKYLDCGGDMFFEAAVMNWLSNGASPNGMVIRLQGFDKGVFGGNFHTHNMVHTPPGLDVVCFSNGGDWVRGMRHAVRQARAGRVVMVVDSTALLNERHLVDEDKDDKWMCEYPEKLTDEMGFDEVTLYDVGAEYHEEGAVGREDSSSRGGGLSREIADEVTDLMLSGGLTVKALKAELVAAGLSTTGRKVELKTRVVAHRRGVDESAATGGQIVKVAIVTYGNGVRTAMRYAHAATRAARDAAEASGSEGQSRVNLSVIDMPCLSQTPEGLRERLVEFDAVVFADVCKAGSQFPLAGVAADLQSTGHLPGRHWRAVGAANTYNPLGNTSTFLNEEDLRLAVGEVLKGLD